MVSIGHVVNQIQLPQTSQLYLAQNVTFKSMIAAKENTSNKENISLFAIGFSEDEPVIPKEFVALPSMKRSILDIGNFQVPKKFPLLAEILKPLAGRQDIDYVVYTNIDISLMPFFYDNIRHRIEMGADSMIINRRVIKTYDDIELINLYSQAGDLHPGYDCFVFRRELIQKFNLEDVCIGANWIGRSLYVNLLVHSRKLEVIKDAHLTFHLGEDAEWASSKYLDYDRHNKSNVEKIIKEILKSEKREEIRNELVEIIKYMESWYPDLKQTPVQKISLLRRIKNKIKRALS